MRLSNGSSVRQPTQQEDMKATAATQAVGSAKLDNNNKSHGHL